MTHYPETLRLAVALRTTHTFTLSQFLDALKNTTCCQAWKPQELRPLCGAADVVNMESLTRWCVDCWIMRLAKYRTAMWVAEPRTDRRIAIYFASDKLGLLKNSKRKWWGGEGKYKKKWRLDMDMWMAAVWIESEKT